MGLRPGHCYSSLKDRAYTRIAITVPSKNYVGTSPGIKTRQFNMGEVQKQFTHILDLITKDAMQVRDNAIEAARIAIGRYLTKVLGKEGFFMRIRVYPHQILRENKQAQGAHADRIQKGMSQSFGKPIGRAIRTRKGEKLISILVNEENVEIAKEALLRAKSKMPCRFYVTVGTDVKSIGTKPRKIKEEVIEEAVEEAKAEKKVEGKAEAKTGKEEAKEGEKKAEAKTGKEEAKGAEKKK